MGEKPGYSDIEVQNFAVQWRYPANEAGSQIEGSKNFEPTEHGLDNNEVAELIGFDRALFIQDVDNGNQTEEASFTVEYGMGADIGSDGVFNSFLPNLAGDGTTFPADVDDPDNTTPQQNLIYEDDDPAQLDYTTMAINATFSSAAEGISGGGTTPFQRREVNYRDMYSHGPVFDRSDDISIGLELDADTSGSSGMNAGLYLQLRWMVYTVDGYRAEFDFPSMA